MFKTSCDSCKKSLNIITCHQIQRNQDRYQFFIPKTTIHTEATYLNGQLKSISYTLFSSKKPLLSKLFIILALKINKLPD